MKTVTTENNNTIKYWTDSKEMPIGRYAKLQKFLLVKTGIGDTIDDVSAHYTKLFSYLAHEKNAEARTEAENLFYNHYAILNNEDFIAYAFAAHVHSIDGVQYDDISDDGLQVVIEKLKETGISYGEVESIVMDTKKKIVAELQLYFPKILDPTEDYQFYQLLTQLILLKCDALVSENPEETNKEKIEAIEAEILMLSPPMNFRSEDENSKIIELEKYYAALTALIESNGTPHAGRLPVFDFFARIDFIKRQKK